MSLFRFTESRDSRALTAKPPTFVSRWTAAGSNDDSFVKQYAIGATPDLVSTSEGTLYRHDVKVDPVGFELFKVTVPYTSRKSQLGQYRLSFDTTGGTVHISNSKQTRAIYAESGVVTEPDHKQLIGVHGDQVDGTDIVIPALKITVHFKHPLGIISLPRIKSLARWTGAINGDPFLTFEAGEVLFLGAAGSEGTDVETEVAYQFAMSENADDLSIGAIANIVKKGWDAAWISYKDAVSGNAPAKQPEFVYVERVYEEIAMAAALGFGGS